MGKGKKLSTNPKAADARAAKEAKKQSAAASKAKAQEYSYWDQHANPVQKRDLKRQEAEKKAAAAQKKKQELSELKRQEEEAMARVGKKKVVQTNKVTKREIDLMKEKQKQAYDQIADEREKRQSKTVEVEDYEKMLDVEIDNKTEKAVDARTLDEAVSQVSLQGIAGDDRHPEKRAKAMFAAYFERRLPEMKEEMPGLKLMQYKSRAFDEFQRHPDNPRNHKL
jgi:hypothetical protein